MSFVFSLYKGATAQKFFVLLPLCIVTILCIGILGFSQHDFHTSITRMDFNAKEKSFEISIRVFTDDLEKALSKDNNSQKFVVLNNDKNDVFVEKYIRKHFGLLAASKQKKTYTYIGKEQEADATWIYVEVPCPESIVGFSMQNSIMLDLFDDQVNLVNFNYQGQKKSYIFKTEDKILPLGF